MSTSTFISTGQLPANSNIRSGMSASGVPRSAVRCGRNSIIPADSRGEDKLIIMKRNKLIPTPSGTMASFNFDDKSVVVTKQPTYQLGPKPARSFSYSAVEGVIRSVLNERLEDLTYNAKHCTELTCTLSEAILSQIKLLPIERYKFICTVIVGEKQRQGISATSRCAWDEANDNYASVVYENKSIYAVANVYGVYTV